VSPTPPDTRRPRSLLLPLFLLFTAVASPTPARSMPPADTPRSPERVDEYSGWFHDAGNLLLHMSNRGQFGRLYSDRNFPSAEWPAGSDDEYLWGAGLWVAGVVTRGGQVDTLCSNGLFQLFEFRNFEPREGCGLPREGICRSYEGAPDGLRRFDDDGDGLVDEDPLDGVDNDGDGRFDEDFAGISQQMFRTTYYDTSRWANSTFPSEVDWHTPMGLRVDQESYQWTDPAYDDFTGIEFRVTNVSPAIDDAEEGWDIRDAYIGFMVDADCGRDPVEGLAEDDQASFAQVDTVLTSASSEPVHLSLTMGYMFDTPEKGGDDVPGYLGVLFLGHTVDTTTAVGDVPFAPREVGIHCFKTFARDANDPRDDLERYRYLRGDDALRPTIDPPAARPRDYRFLVSAGPFSRIPPGSTLTFQVAFVAGEMVSRPDPVTGELRRLPDLTNPIHAQRVYDGFHDEATGETVHWATSSPPPPPNIRVTPNDRSVVIEWDDSIEDVPDPLTGVADFAGYQVWKAEGWRRDSNVPSESMWRIIADYSRAELSDVDTDYTGIGRYRFVDTRVHNGFWYWYAVSAYDEGSFRLEIDDSVFPPDTVRIRLDPPKYGKYSQNMVRVMPRSTPTQTLDDVYVAPNPYRESAAWDLAETAVEPTGRRVKFFNVPPEATVRIFSLSGDLVQVLEHDAREASTQLSWNLISRNNQDTVSGIYLYHVETPDGREAVGKFVVVR